VKPTFLEIYDEKQKADLSNAQTVRERDQLIIGIAKEALDKKQAVIDELVTALSALLSEYRNADNSKAEQMAEDALKHARGEA